MVASLNSANYSNLYKQKALKAKTQSQQTLKPNSQTIGFGVYDYEKDISPRKLRSFSGGLMGKLEDMGPNGRNLLKYILMAALSISVPIYCEIVNADDIIKCVGEKDGMPVKHRTVSKICSNIEDEDGYFVKRECSDVHKSTIECKEKVPYEKLLQNCKKIGGELISHKIEKNAYDVCVLPIKRI